MDKTLNYLKKILTSQKKVVLACSTGPDSMALFHILLKLKQELNFELIIAHINHKVRKQSEEEALFIKELCQKEQLTFEYYEITEKISSNFHSKSRIIRYNFLENIIKKYQANYLMTAHHGDDLIETILMRLDRGSNLKGYSGFNLVTQKQDYQIIRPLIFYTKKDIEEYLNQNNYKYFIDSTNLEDEYPRNRYRHHILPLLKQENQNIHEKYYKYSCLLTDANNFINNYLQKILPNIYHDNILEIKLYLQEDSFIQHQILEYILSTLYIDNLYLVQDTNINEIIKIINSPKPNLFLKLPDNHTITKKYSKLYVDNQTFINNKNNNTKDIIFKEPYYYEDTNYIIIKQDISNDNSNNTIYLNTKELSLPLHIHNKHQGDKIWIKNSQGYSKVKNIFIDNKIPFEQRNNIPIIYDDNNEILWIPGLKKSKYTKTSKENYNLILNFIKK